MDFHGEMVRRQAREGFEVTNEMGLIVKVQSIRNVRQRFKLPCFDESHSLVKTLHANIELRRNPNALTKPPFKMAL